MSERFKLEDKQDNTGRIYIQDTTTGKTLGYIDDNATIWIDNDEQFICELPIYREDTIE